MTNEAPNEVGGPTPRRLHFSLNDYAQRWARALGEARHAGLDGLLIAPGPDLQYFCGYVPTAVLERPTLIAAPTRGAPSMLVPALERPDAMEAPSASLVRIETYPDGDNPYARVARLFDGPGDYGISDTCWTLHLLGLQREMQGSRFYSFTDCLPMLRAVKTEEEINRLAAAAAAADDCYALIRQVRFGGRTENQVARDLVDLLMLHGHTQVDFAIVASGPNGANPHHLASDRVIQKGDMVVLDFGGLMDGYGSDTTRTVHVGEPTAEEREVHDLVVRAQQSAFETVRPGVPCSEIDRAGREVINAAGYGEFFIHRIGHGIGMTTHEPPHMVEGEATAIVPGMCFSIEPGVYLPGRFGVRIEDIVVVTDHGARRLNTSPHEIQVVE